MKILRDTEWTPLGWRQNLSPISGPVYLFQHKKFGDIVAIKEAKFIDVAADIVYFYNAEKQEISVSGSRRSEHGADPSSVQLKRAAN